MKSKKLPTKPIKPKAVPKGSLTDQLDSARDRLIAQFPEADERDLARASRPDIEYRTNGKKIDRPPKDQFFKTPKEGRVKPTMPTKKVPKLKQELWNTNTLVNFFRTEGIHADKETKGWHLFHEYDDNKSRIVTQTNQLDWMLGHSEQEFMIKINRLAKHIVISRLPF